MHWGFKYRCNWSDGSLTNTWLLYLDTTLSHNLAVDEDTVGEPREYAIAFLCKRWRKLQSESIFRSLKAVRFNTAFNFDSLEHLELFD